MVGNGVCRTNDLKKGAAIATKIQSGVRGVNAHPGGGPGTPFGGVKQSGIGVGARGCIPHPNHLESTGILLHYTNYF